VGGITVERRGVRVVIHVALPCPIEHLEGAARLMRDLYADQSLELEWTLAEGELVLRVASPGTDEEASRG